MTKDLFKKQQYNIIGPGGVKCPCCNDFNGNTKNKAKEKLNRIKRRKLRQETNKEINNYYEERECING